VAGLPRRPPPLRADDLAGAQHGRRLAGADRRVLCRAAADPGAAARRQPAIGGAGCARAAAGGARRRGAGRAGLQRLPRGQPGRPGAGCAGAGRPACGLRGGAARCLAHGRAQFGRTGLHGSGRAGAVRQRPAGARQLAGGAGQRRTGAAGRGGVARGAHALRLHSGFRARAGRGVCAMSLRRRLVFASVLSIPLLLAFVAWLALAIARQGGLAPFQVPAGGATPVAADAATLARGRYLAAIGNCAGCHTASGGAPYAGGRGFDTPYGTVYSSNLTPHAGTGIGDWSLAEFRHAMRHGVSRNGVQSPVFPYANFARLDDADIEALYAWLRSLPPVDGAPPANALGFPANLPGAMTAWRLLYYRPVPVASGAGGDPLQRGRYLVDGIGHCNLCHGSRGTLSSQHAEGYLAGGQLRGWYAPALDAETLERYPAAELA